MVRARPPEAVLIEEARRKIGLTQAEAAAAMNISTARWKELIAGYRVEHGREVDRRGKAETYARMAEVVGLAASAFRRVRPEITLEMMRRADPRTPEGRLLAHLVALRAQYGDDVFAEAVAMLAPQTMDDQEPRSSTTRMEG